ncbi:MAG: GntR family transcriptional regulator [Nonlabens sp.]
MSTPKYKKIVQSIEDMIINGRLKRGDRLPSLNELREKHSISRDTVLMGFNELKHRGVIKSVVGKGYYVTSESVAVQMKIFLLFDEMNSFKEVLYNSFLSQFTDAQVDVYFHHFNKKLFERLITDAQGNYSHYVIMPANFDQPEEIINTIPADKVYILDQVPDALRPFPSVYQNFEIDIFNGLSAGLESLYNYQEIILLHTDKKQPLAFVNGCKRFCQQHGFSFEICNSVADISLKMGTVYLTLDDQDLIYLIKSIKESSLEIARDIGIISYNDTMLKEVVADGITTISTDFELMGTTLASMILNQEVARLHNPSHFISRNSL